jgi:protocatechuate 3,4-dioxygenase alpha subunit
VKRATPAQTVGPFFRFGLDWLTRTPVAETAAGDLLVCGAVRDVEGVGVPDALLEFWHADGDGRFPPGRSGFHRCLTDNDGCYRFTTSKPGRVDADQAPHIDVSVFARGLLQRIVTRIYFADEAAANATDPLLASIDPDRRETLLAQEEPDGVRFDIHLCGPRETVFLVW